MSPANRRLPLIISPFSMSPVCHTISSWDNGTRRDKITKEEATARLAGLELVGQYVESMELSQASAKGRFKLSLRLKTAYPLGK